MNISQHLTHPLQLSLPKMRYSGGPISIEHPGYTLIKLEDSYRACAYGMTMTMYIPFMKDGLPVILENTRPPQGDVMLDTTTNHMYVFDGKKWHQLIANQ